MCRDCGCSSANVRGREKRQAEQKFSMVEAPRSVFSIQGQGHSHRHTHPHAEIVARAHHPVTDIDQARRIELEASVLFKNDRLAEENRRWFRQNQIRVVNIISSPGSGKTSMLVKTIEKLQGRKKIAILVGDQEGDFDAQRMQQVSQSIAIKQLNTLSSCHLDAEMISKQRDQFISKDLDLLIIENIGNLVCPAAFDLGENEKIAFLSTTEGEDKPAKYPLLFHEASLIVITKTDLIPHLDWDQKKCEEHIRNVNRVAPILHVSSKTGEGFEEWLSYLMK